MTNDETIKKFPYFTQTIAKQFSFQTNLQNFREEGKKPFDPKIYVTVNYKGYPRFEKIKLPEPTKLSDFHRIMMKRKSSRSFSGESISIQELSTLLYYSAGLRDLRG